ncbi:sensor histidine kinase [Terricaulis silvestris]|nr:HAMP domain-containing sensor histidine kinase [Terricaulis silvestris]
MWTREQRARVVAAAAMVAVALPGALTVVVFSTYRQSAIATGRSEDLLSDIRQLDEVLTTSALLYARTGERRWRWRYEAGVEDLDEVLASVERYAPTDEALRHIHEISTANDALVDMETRAFEMTADRQGQEAYALLTSTAYDQEKRVYANGLNLALAEVRDRADAATRSLGVELLLAALGCLAGLFACFAVWFGQMRRHLTEEERLQDSLRRERDAANRANATKTRFLANMSHELRTPLNAIVGYSEMLKEDADADGRVGDANDHDRIIAAASTLLRLINDLLDISKAEAGRIVLKVEDFAVSDLIERVVGTVDHLARARANQVVVDVAPNIGATRSDEFRLGQCLINLLSNAAKFTEQGEIRLSARREGEDLVFVVTDTGIGMTAEQMGRIFKAFVQADDTVTRTHGGTGLGLAITRELAQLLGGDIRVESAPGQGSTFTLCVSAVLAPAAKEMPALAA